MSSNYTGDPTATQAPGPAITPGAVPIANLPADGDALAAASVAQMAKESMDFVAYLMQCGVGSPFGDGSDGNVTISTTVTLTRAVFYNNLTVTTGGTLVTAGFPVFVRSILTLNNTGVITANGQDGTGASPGGGGAVGMLLGGGAGGAGGGAAANGTARTNSFGGVGGIGGGISSGAGGTVSALAAALGTPRMMQSPPGFVLGISGGVAATTAYTGGSGGGGGAGGGGSGGGGGGGGVLYVFARRILFTGGATAAALLAAGGRGGNGGASADGAGGGGGGGVAIIGYGFKTVGITFSAATNTPGGAHGTDGGSCPIPSTSGASGTVIEIALC